MKNDFYYRIAGFDIMISTFCNLRIDSALPSFIPFKLEKPVNGPFLIRCEVRSLVDVSSVELNGDLLDETENEMGIIRLYEHYTGYMLAVKTNLWNEWHYMQADKQFKAIVIYTRVHDNNENNELSSLLRIAFSQSILKYEAVSVHAAAVYSAMHNCGLAIYQIQCFLMTTIQSLGLLEMKYMDMERHGPVKQPAIRICPSVWEV